VHVLVYRCRSAISLQSLAISTQAAGTKCTNRRDIYTNLLVWISRALHT